MIRNYIQLLHRRAALAIVLLGLVSLFFADGVWKLFGGDLRHLVGMWKQMDGNVAQGVRTALRQLRLRVDTSDDLFLSPGDPELQKYREGARIFGDDRFLISLLEFDDVFTPEHMALISHVSEAVSRLPGTKRVSSLTHEPLFAGTGKSLGNARIASRLPKTTAAAEKIRTAVLSDSFFVKNLVSEDGRFAAIMVRSWPHVRADQLDYLVKRFEQTVRLESRLPDTAIRFAGNHVQTIELHRATLRDMRRLLPVSALIISVFLVFVLRSAPRVALLLALTALSLVWTFGFLGWIGKSMTPLDVILPTLLMTLTTTYSLQFMTRHMQIWAARGASGEVDPVECCEATADESFFSLFLAQLTTAIGAASLCLTDIPAIRQFGMLSAVGTVFTAILIYTFLPVVMMVLPMGGGRSPSGGRWMSKLADMSQTFHRHKTLTLVAAFGLTLVLSAGLFSLRVESDPKRFFKSDAPIRVAFSELEARMGGALSLSVVFDGGAPGALKDPWTLGVIESLEQYAAKQPHVLKTISFVSTVKRLNRAFHTDEPGAEAVPQTREKISQLLLLASFGEDPSNFDRYVDYDYQRGRIEIRVENAGSKQTLALAAKLQQFINERWPSALNGYVTGDYYMSCKANDAILKGQVRGFLGTVVVVFIVMWVCFGSSKVGFLAMVPNVAPIAAVLGIMGYMGVQIDMATALLASVALGIALDDTIHFVVHYMRSIRTQPKGHLAVREVVGGGVGRAMVFTNVSLALGFSVLLLSDFAPVRMFGFFMIVAMLMACFDDFVMMPGLLAWIPLVGIWDRLRIKFKTDVTRGIPLFSGLAVSDIKKIVSMGRLMTVPDRWPLMQEGSLGDEMFVILDGSVTVQKSGKTVTVLGRGETVGEMGLISEHPRSADVLVGEETSVFAFGYEALERLERRYPRLATKFLHNLAAILSRRLAETTEQLR